MVATDDLVNVRPFLPNQNPDEFLVAVVEELCKQKKIAKAWGKTTLEISWQDGQPKHAEITDATRVKFA